MKSGNVLGVDCFIEAAVFDGGTDDGASRVWACGAGNDIDVWRSNDKIEGERWGYGDGEHLSFSRNDRVEGVARERCRPGTGAVDAGGGREGAGGCVDLDSVWFGADETNGGVGAEIDAGGLDCCKEGVGELAGIDAVLIEMEDALAVQVELGKQIGNGVGGEECGGGWMSGGEGLKGNAGLEGDGDSRERFDGGKVFGVEREA